MITGIITFLVIFAVIGSILYGQRLVKTEKTDAVLGQGVFRLMQLVDQRLVQTNGTGKCDPKLELSLMYFFQEFRRCYIGEHHGMPTEAEMEEMKKKNRKKAPL